MSFFSGESKTKFKLPKYLEEPTNAVAGKVTETMNDPYVAYTSPRTAGLTDSQTWSQDKIQQLIEGGGYKPKDPGTLLEGYSKYMNPYMSEVNDAAIREIMNAAGVQSQNWGAQANMAGAFGDTGYAAGQGAIGSEAQQNIADTTSKNAYDAFMKAMGFAGQDIDNTMALNTQNLQSSQLEGQYLQDLFGMGTTEQKTEQAGLDADYAEFLREQGWDENQIAWAASILGSLPQGNMVQKNKQSDAQTVAGIVGGVGDMLF